MKPIKLSMTAFGPYKDQEVIEFSQLHEHGLFVVSGSTGAGKTTIFDAITYALYDTASGEDRDKTIFLRSDFAEENVDTEVELIFEVKGRMYRIWRKFNAAGGGAKREFYEITGGINVPVVEKFQVKSVQSKVEEILGLTQSQFNQIVMLPQGEFQKLLTSESKHKEEIFRKIFKTERFEKMSAILKDKRDGAKKSFERAEMQQNQYVQQIKNKLPERESELFEIVDASNINLYQVEKALLDEAEYYAQQVTLLKEQADAASEKLNQHQSSLLTQQLLNERLEKFQQRQLQLVELQKKAEHFETEQVKLDEAVRASQIEVVEHEYKTTEQALQVQQKQVVQLEERTQLANQQYEQAQEQYEQQQQTEPERVAIAEKIRRLEDLVPIYKEAAEKQASVDSLQKQVNQQNPRVEQLGMDVENEKQQVTNKQLQIEELEKEAAHFEELVEHSLKVKKEIDLVKQTKAEKITLGTLQEATTQSRESAKESQQQYDQLEQMVRSNHAAYLAATLQVGQPCPVCGSAEHPQVHQVAVEQVDDEQLTKLKATAEKAWQNYYADQSKLELAEKNVAQFEEQLQQQGLLIDNLVSYEESLKTAEAKLHDLRLKKQQLVQLKDDLKSQIQASERLQQAFQAEQQTLSTYQQQLSIEQAILEQSQRQMPTEFATITELTAALEEQCTSEKHYKKAFEDAQKQLQICKEAQQFAAITLQNATQRQQEIQQQFDAAKQQFTKQLADANFVDEAHYIAAKIPAQMRQQLQQDIAEYKQQVHTITTQIEEEASTLKGLECVDIEPLKEALEQAKQLHQVATRAVTEHESYEKECRHTLDALTQVSKEIEEHKGQLLRVENLYNVIRGQNEQKISFERFVQIGYLEKVTNAANERLKVLSNGQYFLKCTGRKEGNAQSGLSIDVFDSSTGQTRDVKTLSGGEKFNASLSLALGMADVIQSAQGSVQIETMFIDEGFGTLDGESLQKAIDILIELQQSGRLIGVISHVEELKNQMPAILHVQKLKAGYSKTSIVIK